MLEIPLGISVNSWNAIKFVVIEIFVSVVFASLWNLYIERGAAKAVRSGYHVTIVPSNLGRFTPAEVTYSAIEPAHTHTRAKHLRSKLILGVVNVLLFALLLLLEYGSSDAPNVKRQEIEVVTARSINNHGLRVARNASFLKSSPKSFLDGFHDVTLRALSQEPRKHQEMANYVLRAHPIDSNIALNSTSAAVSFEKVCGDGPLVNVDGCEKILSPLIGINKQYHLVFARVTRVYPLVEPGSSTRLYDIIVESHNLTGTCHGHRFVVEGFNRLKNHATVQTNGCMLLDRSSRAFAVFPESLRSVLLSDHQDSITLLRRTNDSSPSVRTGSKIIFETKNSSVLSFASSVPVYPVTSALHFRAQGRSFQLLNTISMDFSLFSEYRRHIMLLALGLSGDYYAKEEAIVKLDSQQAAINSFFLGASGGLAALSLVLLAGSLLQGKPGSGKVPVQMRSLLSTIGANPSGCCSNEWREKESSSADMKMLDIGDNGQKKLAYVCKHCEL